MKVKLLSISRPVSTVLVVTVAEIISQTEERVFVCTVLYNGAESRWEFAERILLGTFPTVSTELNVSVTARDGINAFKGAVNLICNHFANIY